MPESPRPTPVIPAGSLVARGYGGMRMKRSTSAIACLHRDLACVEVQMRQGGRQQFEQRWEALVCLLDDLEREVEVRRVLKAPSKLGVRGGQQHQSRVGKPSKRAMSSGMNETS